jgi:predicted nucleic acid-binding OB-fold protein
VLAVVFNLKIKKMENINIGGKPHKVSKVVKEHIEWLRIQLESKERLAVQVEELIEELEDLQRAKINKIGDCLAEVKKHYC